MRRFTKSRVNPKVSVRLVLGLLAFSVIFAGWAFGQSNDGAVTPSRVGEGCLLYRSPLSGRYETVPLVHTDVALDVRGLVAAATVTQQYINNTSASNSGFVQAPAETAEREALNGRPWWKKSAQTFSRRRSRT